MHVRMLGIEVHGGYPFQAGLQIFLHALNEFSRVVLEVQTFAELRGHNDFEEALIARSLPTVEDRGDIYVCSGGVNPCTGGIATVRSGVACDIASVCLPLTLVFVFCVRHSDGHPLATERSETAEQTQIVIGCGDGARGLSSERIEAPIRRLRHTSADRRSDFALTDGA